jgi:hypothetical protein
VACILLLADRPERALDVADVSRVEHEPLALCFCGRRRDARDVVSHLLDLLSDLAAAAAAAGAGRSLSEAGDQSPAYELTLTARSRELLLRGSSLS